MIVSSLPWDYCKYLLIITQYRKLGVDVELKEFKLMPHGFLNYNFPIMGMKDEAMEGIKTGSKWLSELSEDTPKK